MTGGGDGVGDRGVQVGGGGSGRSTPHLTSPLEGGRDEFGEGVGVGMGGAVRVGSCLRRNDGEGRGDDGSANRV